MPRFSYFTELSKPVSFEGPDSSNPYAFKFYNPDEKIEGASMVEHLRPAIVWWHGLCAEGEDPFGGAAHQLSWPAKAATVADAKKRVDAGAEALDILGMPFYAFHCSDLAPNGGSWSETEANLNEVLSYLQTVMGDRGKRCLWVTQNTFSEPCFTHGGGTGVDADVWAYAAVRTRIALEMGKTLGAENHVFWDGRGGFSNLINRDLERDLLHKGRLLQAAVEYRNQIGSDAQFLTEPKPKEPTTVQYDADTQSVLAFLQWYDRREGTSLFDEFKLNLEDNHATLAGKPFHFEIDLAGLQGKLGSIDANQGHPLLLWDTDHMPYDPRNAALVWYYILKHGGLGRGGSNFDAKVRRGSVSPMDRIRGHILAIDTYAFGLRVAAQMRKSGRIEQLLSARYRGWDTEFGKSIDEGSVTLELARQHIVTTCGDQPPTIESGREEEFEQLINQAMAQAIRAM